MAATGGNSRLTAVTFGLLQQYMREQQQLVLEAEETDSRTMQLFPMRAGTSSQPSHDDHAEAHANCKAALTMFYEGRVLVFEDFPADKAKELMEMAGSGSSLSTAPPNNMGAPVPAEKPAVPSDLPIARKASLQRFLQKRKERVGAAMGPYYPKPEVVASPAPEKDVPASATSKQVMTLKDKPAASWLRL